MSPRIIEISIDELLLNGCNGFDKYRVGDVLESELQRLILQNGIPAQIQRLRNVAAINAGVIPRPNASGSSEEMGINLATAVFAALRQAGE